MRNPSGKLLQPIRAAAVRLPHSPLAAHLATPAELRQRLEASRAGHPFVVFRDPERGQQIVSLLGLARLTIGRRPESDIALEWDGRVSRLHAELLLIGGEWVVTDDGLSANGTWLNEARVEGRRRLRDGDLIGLGETLLAFCSPAEGSAATISVKPWTSIVRVTPAQRRVLVALCRPFLLTGSLTTPSNAELAAELFLSIDSVKTHMKALFEAFELDGSVSRLKRTQLVEFAVRNGSVTARDL
jgi:pSer/pThr/pTyr-binding forkhead associated (FHA) protein